MGKLGKHPHEYKMNGLSFAKKLGLLRNKLPVDLIGHKKGTLFNSTIINITGLRKYYNLVANDDSTEHKESGFEYSEETEYEN